MAERTVVVRLKAVVDAYQKAMRDAAGETSKVTAAVKVLGQSGDDLKRVGDQMTKWVTVPLAAVGVGATKAASDFETTFSRMVGLANVPAGEVDKLRESVLGLAAQTGRGPQELAEALYYIRSSGVSAAQSMNVLEVAAKASAAGLGSTADIAKAVGFAVNAYGEQNLSASRATDILVAAVREGTIEAGALAPVMGRLIPTASALGIGFDQVAGTLAVMSRTGLDAEEAATSLSAVFSTMLGTSAAGKQLLDEHGLSLAKLRETAAGPGGVVAAMRMLDASFAGNDEALSTIIPNIRAFRAFMNVLAQDGAKVDGVLRAVSDSTGATDEAFGAFQSTNAAKLQKAFTEIKVALIQIGAALSPLASGLAQIAGPAAGAFGHLPDWLQSSVLGFVGLLAAIGPVSRIAGTLAANFDLLRSAASAALDKVALGAYNAAGSLSTLSIIGAGVTTVFVGLALQHAENERIAAELAATENALADAIRNAGSSVAGFEQKLRDAVAQDAPFAAMLAHAGVSTKDMAAALDQGGAAWDAMKAKLLAGAQAAGVSGQDLARLRVSLEYLPERAAAAKQHVEDAAAAIGDSGDQAGAAARGVDTLGSSMLTVSDSAYTWEKALEGVQKQVSEMFARTFDVMDAQQGFADALDGVDTAAKQSSGSTRDLTSQQRTLERATRSVADAQRGLADAEANLARVRQGASARELQGASLGLREAQLGVAQAQQRVRDAQVRLNEARKSGDPNKVRQADLELKAAKLGVEQATMALADAQDRLTETQNRGKAGSDDLKRALDEVEQAQRRLADATQAQDDAEAQLRKEGSTGGPVADRQRAIRTAIDQTVDAGQRWIDKLIEQKRPIAEVAFAIDAQRDAVQKLIDRYGDANGKLEEHLRLLLGIKIVTGAASLDPYRGAEGILGDLNRFLGGFRADGGRVRAGVPYVVGERRAELFVPDSDGTILPSVPAYAGAMAAAPSFAGGRGQVVAVRVEAPLYMDGKQIAIGVGRATVELGGVRGAWRN